MSFRKKEPWMAPGSVVCLPSGMGTIVTVVECKGSTELMPFAEDRVKDREGRYYPQESMVLKVYVRPDGVMNAWPYNPWEVVAA